MSSSRQKSTLTHDIHSAPGDYYRFSPEAVQTVLLEGYQNVLVKSLLVPPRLIGYGTKPCPRAPTRLASDIANSA